jgi:hypothetical protein
MRGSRWLLALGSVVAVVAVIAGPTAAFAGLSPVAALHDDVVAAELTTAMPATTNPVLAALLPKKAFSIPALIDRCTPAESVSTEPICRFGDVSADATVVLYGNSEAQSWAPAFARLGRADHFSLAVIAKPACGTLLDPAYLAPKGTVSSVCYLFSRWAAKQIVKLHPALVVVATTPGQVLRSTVRPGTYRTGDKVPADLDVAASPGRTATDLTRFLDAIKGAHTSVVLLGAIPENLVVTGAEGDPNDCLLANETDIQACLMVEPTTKSSEWAAALQAAATQNNVPYIDVSSLLCANGVCPPVVDGVLTHFNALHVTGAFASLAAAALGEMIGSRLP